MIPPEFMFSFDRQNPVHDIRVFLLDQFKRADDRIGSLIDQSEGVSSAGLIGLYDYIAISQSSQDILNGSPTAPDHPLQFTHGRVTNGRCGDQYGQMAMEMSRQIRITGLGRYG